VSDPFVVIMNNKISLNQHQHVIIKASINVVKMLDKLDKMKIQKWAKSLINQ